MKITESYLRKMVKEEIQALFEEERGIEEGILDNVKQGASKILDMVKALLDRWNLERGAAGIEHMEELKPVPTRYLEDIYTNVTGKPFGMMSGDSGAVYRNKLKYVISAFMDQELVKHENGKLIVVKTGFSTPDHGNP